MPTNDLDFLWRSNTNTWYVVVMGLTRWLWASSSYMGHVFDFFCTTCFDIFTATLTSRNQKCEQRSETSHSLWSSYMVTSATWNNLRMHIFLTVELICAFKFHDKYERKGFSLLKHVEKQTKTRRGKSDNLPPLNATWIDQQGKDEMESQKTGDKHS
ncbi:hypothetical protein L6164_035796 [Bauhinia variegata]|uniref:Uncharacterized protein n=1 Tax=Bauhinia variegata TaxID=167791 RepID=A0ACB9KF32_BAUVA|nr:hypothetical protein L6164_035796 [Bauhinia variegata]